MSTATRLQHFGPADHGRELTYEEFMAGDYAEGHKYELIDGRLYVSPFPNFPHDWVRQYVAEELTLYKFRRPDIVKRLSSSPRIFVPGRRKTTCPEPDFAIYRVCPPGPKVKWQDISPMIVVEVVSESDPDKDYVRNVELYEQVSSILEYWLFDRCGEDDGPTLRVYHCDGGTQKWKTAEFGPEYTYRTLLLPEFELPVRPPQ